MGRPQLGIIQRGRYSRAGMGELRGKRALVTGGGKRLGAAIVEALAAEGMELAIHYHGSREGAEAGRARIEAAGGRATLLQADLGDRAQARALADAAVEALGGLDLLVLNAANYERVDFDAIDDAAWDRALGLNVASPFALAQQASTALRAARGSIVVITCISRLAPYRHYLPYEVSKAAAYQLMRLLALELAPEVRVNAVAPGTVLPPVGFSEAELQELVPRIPLGRVGDASDVASAVVHLARADWMTGQELVVDGGRSLA